MKAIGRQSFLVVFDFDHTIVDCNTDEVIPAHLGRGETQRALIQSANRLQWSKLMDTVCAPFTTSQLREAAHASVTVDPAMPAMFAYLRQQQQRYAAPVTETGAPADQPIPLPPFVEIDIASDSNLVFIEAALEGCLPGVAAMVSQIHSNTCDEVNLDEAPAATDNACQEDEAARDEAYNAHDPSAATSEGRFVRHSRIGWYEPKGHACPCCVSKPNMCKSIIIERLLHTTTLIDPTIVFVGDGANDYCPILNVLRPRDYMFCRRNFPLHKILSEPAARVGGCCTIGLWTDAKELRQLFEAVFEQPHVRLPTLARFRDVGRDEFRSVTMNTRIPAILHRTLEDNLQGKRASGESLVSHEGARLVRALIESAKNNGPVPPLPGQSVVPAWLRNYAFTSEYDALTPNGSTPLQPAARPSHTITAASCGGAQVNPYMSIAPRWGQIPWIHGEIYFYHLLWQYLMLTDAGGHAAEAAVNAAHTSSPTAHATAAPTTLEANVMTPYYAANPLFSQDSTVLLPPTHPDAVTPLFQTPGMVTAPVMPTQSLAASTPASLIDAPLATAKGVVVSVTMPDGMRRAISYADLLPTYPHDGLLPARDVAFAPYRDIFLQEKTDVLVKFIDVRVVPMLACEPWSAGDDFIGVLLRWSLWGNGLDLSMFTIEQLSAAHGGGVKSSHSAAEGGASDADAAAALRTLREREHRAAYAQDSNLIGNETAGVEAYLLAHVERARANTDPAFINHLDIVTDNVGVEVLSDLCLALWFLAHAENAAAPPTVRFHVKPFPYYVSDVTPADFGYTLYLLEQSYSPSSTNTRTPAECDALRAVLAPFIALVRDAFRREAFTVEADTVWTSPSEYRDLPPRVINRFFYTQHIDAAPKGANLSASAPSAAALYRTNKDIIQSQSVLVIFKGDLNYRRLVGDRYWNRNDFLTTLVGDAQTRDLSVAATHYTPLQHALVDELLQDTPADCVVEGPSFEAIISAFWPTHVLPVCAVRTIKSECCVGVPAEIKQRLDQTEANGYKKWRLSGKYGEILFAH